MRKDNHPTKYKVSPLIREQVPDWVRDDHSIFVDFLEAYYEWMEMGEKDLDHEIETFLKTWNE